MSEETAYIGLGSNMGDAVANLARALEAVAKIPGVRVLAASGVYLTEPQGYKDQPWFANMAAKLLCQVPETGPEELLTALLNIETDMGRVRQFRDGPRVIDLDLLLFGERVLRTERLILPHPRILTRAFVLIPLLEIEPDLRMPDGARAKAALAGLTYTLDGRRIGQ